MLKTAPILGLYKYKSKDESFITGVDGTFKLMFFYDIFYSFLPFPFFNYFPPTVYEMCINCILAVTDKRIVVLEKDSDGNIDEKYIHSFDFKDVTVDFKKKLGKRIFVIEKKRMSYFNYCYNVISVDIDSSHIIQAENIYSIIQEHRNH